MELFLIRHAEAARKRSDGPDSGRSLTPEGRRGFRKAVRGLGVLGIRFDSVLHSPWRRAAQTAALLRPLVEGPVRPMPGLARRPTRRLVAGLRGERVALVGHEPWLGELLSLLLFGHRRGADRFRIAKGGIVRLEGDPRPAAMVLRALLGPVALRCIRPGTTR